MGLWTLYESLILLCWTSLVAQTIKNLPTMQETLGQRDPLEKGMAAHSSILA